LTRATRLLSATGAPTIPYVIISLNTVSRNILSCNTKETKEIKETEETEETEAIDINEP
jgi:hypothetical protein